MQVQNFYDAYSAVNGVIELWLAKAFGCQRPERPSAAPENRFPVNVLEGVYLYFGSS